MVSLQGWGLCMPKGLLKFSGGSWQQYLCQVTSTLPRAEEEQRERLRDLQDFQRILPLNFDSKVFGRQKWLRRTLDSWWAPYNLTHLFFRFHDLKEWKNSPIRYSRSRLLNTHQSSNIKAGLKKQQPASAAEDRRVEIHYNILQRYKWCIIHGAMIHNKPIVRIDTRMICVDILEVVCAIKLYQIGGHAKKQLIKLHETCLFVGAEATTSKSLGLAAAKRVPWAQRRDFDCKRFACLTRPIEHVDWFLLICTVSFVGIKWCFTFYYSKSPLNHDLGNMFRFLLNHLQQI